MSFFYTPETVEKAKKIDLLIDKDSMHYVDLPKYELIELYPGVGHT